MLNWCWESTVIELLLKIMQKEKTFINNLFLANIAFLKKKIKIICIFAFLLCSPELEKGLKKRVKLHAYENGENGQTANRENGQHAQNEDIDSDDNYTEVRRNRPSRESRDLQNVNRSEGF